jgi:hypothetical protein
VLTANDVVQAVAAHLRNKRYRVDRVCSTSERGPDIDAVHPSTGKRLLVEGKGGTSSKPGTRRFDKGFNRSQARSHVAVAFYCVARLQQGHSLEGAQVALAFR